MFIKRLTFFGENISHRFRQDFRLKSYLVAFDFCSINEEICTAEFGMVLLCLDGTRISIDKCSL